MRQNHIKKMNKIRVLTALLIVLSLLCSAAAGLGVPLQPGYAETQAAGLAERAVDFINTQYQSGEAVDGYAAYVLDLADEDLAADKWNKDGQNVKSRLESLAGLLGNSNSLITYITATQNAGGSFGPYSNEYGTKAPLQALAAIKAGATGTALSGQVNDAIAQAVGYYQSGYQSGAMPYEATGWGFDYRCVEALVTAGEDLSAGAWASGGNSLKEAVITSAAAAAETPQAGAVALAKELSVLCAINPDSADIKTIADLILAQINQSVPGQVYFGGSVYDNVLVLTALGKAGMLDDIDQGQALIYLNSFKVPHRDSWGMPAGAAWRGVTSEEPVSPEEPDLTAQVLTALSYFDGAGDQDSMVYRSIQDGLAYLADIQDLDTAAITAQWDSTFATAETLLALHSLGRSFAEYAGDQSPWVKQSRTKTIAQCLLALGRWDDTAQADRLAALLQDRQKGAGPGQGSFENSVYSDMWAYLALGEAGRINELDTAAARDYIISKQGPDGSWGETFDSAYYADFLSTTQAIRALTYLPDAAGAPVQTAVAKGLTYLKGLQQPDGGVYSTWDDPAVDNSELIVTLARLDQDPAAGEWKNTLGLTPVDYLLSGTMNADGSFGSAGNIFGAAEALSAYLLVDPPNNPGGDGQKPPEKDELSVRIAVVGIDNELLYPPGEVSVSNDSKWGKTALGALHATGLNYNADPGSGFVNKIEGQANNGMNGWMFKVNGVVAAVAGKDKEVRAGDRIIWWYSDDINSNGPDWDSLTGGSGTGAAQTTGITAVSQTGQALGLPIAKDVLAALESKERQSFDDVNQSTGAWAKEPIELLAGAGVLKGVGTGRFEPGRPVTRAEITMILSRAFQLPALDNKPVFTDVAGTEWYAGCVAAGAGAGLVKGYEDHNFRPNNNITREELAVILARALDLLGEPATVGTNFTDAGLVSPWAKDSLAAVVAKGLAGGHPDGTFRPQEPVTRAECAAMVYRAIERQYLQGEQ
ncbi:MAG: Endo-1,4-beta-xylanase A precursor [Pelotomaculum sp. PtaB.Bin104]|nr:MAG: Endo-1,4-beta-xylanase A precursor [Pelotomaculum sp. PtaB.Bin104]